MPILAAFANVEICCICPVSVAYGDFFLMKFFFTAFAAAL